MKISLYTFVKNGLYFDFHIEAMLRQHLPYADEIVVSEAYSTDGTYERIKDIDPKIKVFRTRWDAATSNMLSLVDSARVHCTGDWCVKLDCDEFVPEWEWDRLRRFLPTTDKVLVPMRFLNFYGNYKVLNKNPTRVHWPALKDVIHRNVPEIEFWGDGSNARIRGDWSRALFAEESFECHHFGFVRRGDRLREKWRDQAERDARHSGKTIKRRRLKPPRFLYRFFPFNWMDESFLPDLAVYEGPFIQAVRDDPDEFVRDNWQLYRYLKEHPAGKQ